MGRGDATVIAFTSEQAVTVSSRSRSCNYNIDADEHVCIDIDL